MNLEELIRRGEEDWKSCAEPIFEVSCVNSTPAVLGGPSGDTISADGRWVGLRPSALRGVWRWWVRAILSGMLWNEKRTCTYDQLMKLEALIGLGSVGFSNPKVEAEASVFMLEVESKISPDPIPPSEFERDFNLLTRNRGKPPKKLILEIHREFFEKRRYGFPKEYQRNPCAVLMGIARYALLCSGDNEWWKVLYRKQPIPPKGIQANVRIVRRPIPLDALRRPSHRILSKYGEEVNEVLKLALKCALTLGGVGQMITRGFGKFSLSGDDPVDPEELAKEVSSLNSNFLQEALGYLKVERSKAYPYTPAISSEVFKVEKIDKVSNFGTEASDIWDVLASVGEATLKIRWKMLTRRGPRSPGGDLHTWVLGLPREVRRTGYTNKFKRMISHLWFTPVMDSQWGIFVFGFKTVALDLLSRGLKHSGKHGSVPVKEILVASPSGRSMFSVDEVFEAAFRFVSRSLTG